MNNSNINKIAIFGATSDMAVAVARACLNKESEFFLAARNVSDLDVLAKDLKARGAKKVEIKEFNAESLNSHESLVNDAYKIMGDFDLVLIAHGSLPDPKIAFENFNVAESAFKVNALSIFSLCTALLPHLRKANKGILAVIGSVAGDRGRKKLGIYSSAKASVDAYLSALRQELSSTPIQVLTIKPGIVKTKMTKDVPHGLLSSTPEVVAKDILKAIKKKKEVLYTPWYWQGIMLIIKNIPEKIFKKLSF